MLSKCANPACLSSFLYLHEGKLFRIHIDTKTTDLHSAAGIDPQAKKPVRRVEFFWLCQECSTKMTVSFEEGVGVKIHSLTRAHAIAS
jgi:hypothetical protein